MNRILVENFSENLDRFRVPLSSKERESRKGNIPYYGAAKIIDYVDNFTHSGLSVLIAEDGSVEDENGYPILQLADGKYWVNNHTHVLKGVDNTDTKYLYYALKTIKVAPFVTGAVQKKISQKALNSIQIPYFENKNERIRVVNILESFDQKIQLNTQANQTLEAIAQAIFKSWFVDFDPVRAKAQAILDGKTSDEANLSAMAVISGKAIEDLSQTEYQQLWEIANAFPSQFEDDLPKGWEIEKVGDIVSVVDYVANGSFASLKENVTLLDKPNYAIYVRTTDFNSGFSKDLKYVDEHSYNFLKKSSLNGDEIIISNVGDVGTVFRPPSWLNIPMTLGSNAIALKSENLSNYLYLYFKSSFGQWQIQGITSGSAQMKFNKTSFRGLEILIPNKKILSFFENQLNEIYNKITDNLKENKTLAQTRDELLPKLLSGEIEV